MGGLLARSLILQWRAEPAVVLLARLSSGAVRSAGWCLHAREPPPWTAVGVARAHAVVPGWSRTALGSGTRRRPTGCNGSTDEKRSVAVARLGAQPLCTARQPVRVRGKRRRKQLRFAFF